MDRNLRQRSLWMAATAGLTLVVVVLAMVGAIYLGLFDIKASEDESALSGWYWETRREQAITEGAEEVVVPDLDETVDLAFGAHRYHLMCQQCHGAPGVLPNPLAEGLSPRPPKMQEVAKHRSEAEIFWVVKHGLRRTAMPAWGEVAPDSDLWSVVAFAKKVPQMSKARYRELLASALPDGLQNPLQKKSIADEVEPEKASEMAEPYRKRLRDRMDGDMDTPAPLRRRVHEDDLAPAPLERRVRD